MQSGVPVRLPPDEDGPHACWAAVLSDAIVTNFLVIHCARSQTAASAPYVGGRTKQLSRRHARGRSGRIPFPSGSGGRSMTSSVEAAGIEPASSGGRGAARGGIGLRRL